MDRIVNIFSEGCEIQVSDFRFSQYGFSEVKSSDFWCRYHLPKSENYCISLFASNKLIFISDSNSKKREIHNNKASKCEANHENLFIKYL